MKLFLLPILFIISTKIIALDFHTAHLPPFSLTEGKFAGPFYNIAKEVCTRAKLECTFIVSPWKRIMKNLESGKYKACYVIGHNKTREKWMYFSSPVVKTEYGLFFIKGVHKAPSTFQDLKGFNIVVHEKSNSLKQLTFLQERLKNFNIITERDILTTLKKFTRNRFPKNTLLYGNKDIVAALFKKIGAKNVQYGFKDKELYYYFGFSKKSVPIEVLNKFEMGLQEIKKDGFLEKELKKFNVDYPEKIKEEQQ